jgi:hypothetical protein
MTQNTQNSSRIQGRPVAAQPDPKFRLASELRQKISLEDITEKSAGLRELLGISYEIAH